MKYYVVAPDSSGSKGDEALMRGVLNVLIGADITILTTPSYYNTWQTELLDRCQEFSEKIVPFENIAEGITEKGTLIVVGADVMDGTCGVTPALSRVKAIEKIINMNGSAYVFCSFRQDVDLQILQAINSIEGKIYWLLRDQYSVESFMKQTGKNAEYFPDFAYYCEKYITNNKSTIAREIIEKKKAEGKIAVGLNFSQHSFMSFFSTMNDNSRREYIKSVVDIIKEEIENPFFVLISHDTRCYGKDWWSDTQFQELAALLIEEQYLVISEEIIYPELLTMLSALDYVVSGRMHFAIASLRCDVVPIIYTGAGEEGKYTMSDKCKGMLEDRIGRPDFVANNIKELKYAIRNVQLLSSKLKKSLKAQNLTNMQNEQMLKQALRTRIGLCDEVTNPLFHNKDDDTKTKVLLNMVRHAFREQEIINTNFKRQISDIQKQVNDKQEQLNDKQRQINEKTQEINNIWSRLEVITNELIKCHEELIEQVEKHEKKATMDLSIQESLQNMLHEQGKELDKIKSMFPIRVWYK